MRMGDQIDCDRSWSAAKVEIDCMDRCTGLVIIWHSGFLSSEIPAIILTAILKFSGLIGASPVTYQK
jgi:hypothetical protein